MALMTAFKQSIYNRKFSGVNLSINHERQSCEKSASWELKTRFMPLEGWAMFYLILKIFLFVNFFHSSKIHSAGNYSVSAINNFYISKLAQQFFLKTIRTNQFFCVNESRKQNKGFELQWFKIKILLFTNSKCCALKRTNLLFWGCHVIPC